MDTANIPVYYLLFNGNHLLVNLQGSLNIGQIDWNVKRLTKLCFYFIIKPTPMGPGDYKMSQQLKVKPEQQFEQPIYVIKKRTKRKKPTRPIDVTYLFPQPREFTPEYYDWRRDYADFSVNASDYHEACIIERKIRFAFENNNIGKAIRIFNEELSPLRVLPFSELDIKEKWACMMMQKPESMAGPNKNDLTAILSELCFGKVLEAMCGFNSYLYPSSEREVIALDLCQEALERYEYPKRTRILFDLNQITCTKGLKFFKKEEFDAIVICFGYQYLKNPGFVFKELRRILKKGGKLFLVENPEKRYEEMAVREFSVYGCVHYLKLEKVGFAKVSWRILKIAEPWETGKYYLVEAIK